MIEVIISQRKRSTSKSSSSGGFHRYFVETIESLTNWECFYLGCESDMFHIQSYKNGPNLNVSKAVSRDRISLYTQTLFTRLSSNAI